MTYLDADPNTDIATLAKLFEMRLWHNASDPRISGDFQAEAERIRATTPAAAREQVERLIEDTRCKLGLQRPERQPIPA